jgi:hypothetical protein
MCFVIEAGPAKFQMSSSREEEKHGSPAGWDCAITPLVLCATAYGCPEVASGSGVLPLAAVRTRNQPSDRLAVVTTCRHFSVSATRGESLLDPWNLGEELP